MSEAQIKNVITCNYNYKELLVDEEKYVVGVRKKDDGWQILLTNLVQSFEEVLTRENAIKRCEEMNPFLVDLDYEEILNDLFVDIPKYTKTCSVQCINLAYEIEGGKFSFKVEFTRSNLENCHADIMANFYLSFSELHHRYTCLLEIVRKKDEEIQEYKAQGIELLRKSVITVPFTENIFQSNSKNSKSLDKINVFLNAFKFCESIRNDSQSNDGCTTKDSIGSGSESTVKSDNNGKPVKRPSSSEVRCAVGPKFPKTVKVSKQSSAFKFL